MLEVDISGLLQLAIDVLELVVELHLALHQAADADEKVLHLHLAVDLLYLYRAALLHPLRLNRAPVYTAA